MYIVSRLKHLSLAVLVGCLVSTTMQSSAAKEHGIPEQRVDLGYGFAFIYTVAYEDTNGDVIVRYRMEFTNIKLVQTERRLQYDGHELSIPVQKRGLSGLDVSGTVKFKRSGDYLHWTVIGQGRNRYFGSVGKIDVEDHGRIRIPFASSESSSSGGTASQGGQGGSGTAETEPGKRYSAAVNHPSGVGYFFEGTKYHRFRYRENRVDRIGDTGATGWPGVPARPQAALTHPKGKIYFFVNESYYRFDVVDNRVDRVARIADGWTGAPNRIDAALHHPNDKAYLFSGNRYWRYDYDLGRVDKVGVIGVDGWRGVPTDLDAVIISQNGRAYFLKGRTYHAFDFALDRVVEVGQMGVNGWNNL